MIILSNGRSQLNLKARLDKIEQRIKPRAGYRRIIRYFVSPDRPEPEVTGYSLNGHVAYLKLNEPKDACFARLEALAFPDGNMPKIAIFRAISEPLSVFN